MPSFRFTVPGDPISVNHAYEIVKIKTKGGYMRSTLKKVSGIENYQLIAAAMALRAKPADFAPVGQIRTRYWIRSKRWVDASNCIKIVEDGIAAGLKVNDKWFLPCVEENSKGHAEPHIEVEVEYTQ